MDMGRKTESFACNQELSAVNSIWDLWQMAKKKTNGVTFLT